MAVSAAVNVVYTAVNNFTPVLQRMQTSAQVFERRILSLNNVMDRMRTTTQRLNAVLQGMGIGVGIGSFYALERAIGAVVRIIPDLLNKGLDWLAMLDELQDKSGMSAAAVSKWAYIVKFTGGDVERFSTSVGRLSKVVLENEEKFSRWGIATRDMSGNLLPVDTLLDNIRQKMAQWGPGSATATAALQLLSRSGLDFIDVMTLSDSQIDILTEKMKGFGLNVGQGAITAAENLQRMRNELDLALTGIGTQVATGVLPSLTQLVTAISAAIQANMANIVAFAQKAIGFVTGLISGFFNLNMNLTATTTALGDQNRAWRDTIAAATKYADQEQEAAAATNTAREAIQRQINAIDAQIRALDRREAAHNAANTRRDIMQEIADARKGGDSMDAVSRAIQRQIDAIDKQIEAIRRRRQAQDDAKTRDELVGDIAALEAELAELQGKGIFTAGMTALEAELARQQHESEIIEQQKRIQDAKDRLADHDKEVADRQSTEDLQRRRDDLQDQLRAHQAAVAAAKRLADALERLREFEHDQAVRHQRENLEDRKRNLQDQLQAVKTSVGKYPPILQGITGAFGATEGGVGEALSGISDKMAQTVKDAQEEGRKFAAAIREFFFGKDSVLIPGEHSGRFGEVTIKHEPGALEKLQGAINDFATAVGILKEQLDNLNKNFLTPIGDLLRNLGVTGNNGAGGNNGGLLGSLINPILNPIKQVLPGIVGWGAASKVVPGLPGPLSVFKGLFGSEGIASKGLSSLTEGSGASFFQRLFGGIGSSARTFFGIPAEAGLPDVLRSIIPGATRGAGAAGSINDILDLNSRINTKYGTNLPTGQNYGLLGDLFGLNTTGPGVNKIPGLLSKPTTAPTPASGETQAQAAFRSLMNLDRNTGMGGPLWRALYDSLGAQDQTNNALDDVSTNTSSTVDKLVGGVEVNSSKFDDIKNNTAATTTRLAAGIDTKVINKPSVAVPDATKVYTTGGATVDVNSPGVSTLKVTTPGSGIVEVGGVQIDKIRGFTANTANNTSYTAGMRFASGKLSTTTATGTVTAGGCFVYGTMVQTPQGERRIEEIERGDEVWAYDIDNKRIEAMRVQAVHRHPQHSQKHYRITLYDGRVIEATDTHPLYDPKQGEFVPTEQFSAGMYLFDVDEGPQLIQAVDFMGVGATDFCDLTVARHHNYMVANGILAHNVGQKTAAQGLLGLTMGETGITVGEAGREAVAILRNPRPMRGGDLGIDRGPREIVVPITVVLDGRKIEESTTRRQIRQGAFSSTTIAN